MKPNSSVALHKHSNALVDVLPPEADSSIAMLTADEKPDVSYSDIGMYASMRTTPENGILQVGWTYKSKKCEKLWNFH